MADSGKTIPSEVTGDEIGSSGEDSFVINTGNGENVIGTDREISETGAYNAEIVNVNRKTLENEILEAIRQAGLDDKFWIKKIREEFKVETVEELKNVTKEQVKVFLQNTETTIQSLLRPVFSNLMGIDVSDRESAGSNVFPGADVSEVFKMVENSVVCRGIYFSENIEKLVVERDMVIHGNSDTILSGAYLEPSMCSREFTSRDLMHRFTDHIDKNISVSRGINIFGIDLVDPVTCTGEADTFVGSVHYQLVPVASALFSPDQVDLRPEVISALQEVEQALKLSDYLPGNHFDDFFEKYGSHLCSGVVEFGGILVATAQCSGFKEEIRMKIHDMVARVSEMAFLLGFNGKIQPGQPYKADEILRNIPDISAENIRNITVTIKKFGGSQDAEEKDKWNQKLLKEDGTYWDVINRISPPKGMWEILLKHADQFENHKKLAQSMMKEWETNLHKASNLDQKEDNEKQVASLRKDIKHWIEERSTLNLEELDDSMKRLSDIRTRHQRIDNHWQQEVLYLRAVQTAMVDTAKFIFKINRVENKDKTAMSGSSAISEDQQKKRQLSSLLRHILHPIDRIQEHKFPNLRLVTESIKDIDGIDQMEPFDIQQLLGEWKNYKLLLKLEKESLNLPLKSAQLKLESTIEYQEQSPTKTYDYLIFVGILQIFGFDVSIFKFGYQLSKRNMYDIFHLYESHLSKLHGLQDDKEKQAYIFQVALYNTENKEAAVQYTFRSMAERLHHCFQDINGPDDTINMHALKAKLQDFLPEDLRSDSQSVVHAFENQLRFLCPFKREQREHQKDRISTTTASEDLCPREVKIMEALDMKKYYAGKLTYDKVITLTSGVNDDLNKKPTTLPELPWYFIRHVIGLDSDTRENCYVTSAQTDGDNDNDSESESDSDDQGITNSIHPLDLMKIIMMCADDFLRQELTDKMLRCQYAVPFIVPTLHDSKPENLILLWTMESVMRNVYRKEQDKTKPLVDIKTPLVSFMNVGMETSWKSRLLNKMLSSQQETFWHQELKGGDKRQKISEGLVEVAWFLPGREGDNKFPFPVTFSNLRGNAAHSDVVCDQLFKSSSVICLFVEDIDAEVQEFLHKRSSLERVVIILLHSKREAETMKQRVKKLKDDFTLREDQIIRRTADGRNFDTVFEKIKKTIDSNISTIHEMFCLRELVVEFNKVESMKTDDTRCHFGRLAAQTILRDIDEYNSKNKESAKAKVLPFQSDLESRQKMAELDKELCRQRRRPENTTVEDYGASIKEEKGKLKNKQLQEPISHAFRYFLQCLVNFCEIEKKYFLQCLKQGLNERSVQLLQPLYEEYEKCRLEDESEERDRRLKGLDAKLTHSSLGVEHFFREIGALYENILSFQETRSIEIYNFLQLLPDVMAELWIEGVALEIMDGDAVHIPVEWLTAVLNQVENKTESTVFKVSTVGAQSCGKSTLLNTTFGLNFPVSSGRCTRGAYMQLVKVDESLKEKLKCDYVAVIDSEGLMSRSKADNSEFDNEIATFIIGLSDLTLVMFKDEGNEMQHVLPLAILVFLRMKLVGDQQACHFVYQKRGTVGIMTKQATEIDAFVRQLNLETLAAAIKVDESEQYKKFTDVLHYDPTKDNTYIPSLHDGTEMGKTNPQYARATEKLKSDIIQHMRDLQTKSFQLSSLGDTATRIKDLTEAIRHENFVLGFKSVLAVEAHGNLSEVFDEKQWTIKRAVRSMIQEEKIGIENEVAAMNFSKTVGQLAEESRNKLYSCIVDKIAKLDEEISHYFTCEGCSKCEEKVKHRNLLANIEHEFKEDVQAIKRTLIREMELSLEDLKLKIKMEDHIRELSKDMDDTLTQKVQETIKTRKSEGLGEKAVEEIFGQLWSTAAGDILRGVSITHENENIEAAVQATIKNLLASETHIYTKTKPIDSTVFAVNKAKHMTPRGTWQKVASHMTSVLNDEDVNVLQEQSDNIIESTKKYYDPRLCPQGRPFRQSVAEELFKDVIARIEKVKDERFKIRDDYKGELLHFIENRAVTNFKALHVKYCRESSPQALLRQKKKAYHDLFLVQMGKGDGALTFCNEVLKTIILVNVFEKLTSNELLQVLRQRPMFKNVSSFQTFLLTDMLKEDEFPRYRQYISNYEEYAKQIISKESVQFFVENKRLRKLAKSNLEEVLVTVKTAVQKTVHDFTERKTFISQLYNQMQALKTLKIPHNDIVAFLEMDNVPEKNNFADIIYQQLEETVRAHVMETINTRHISELLAEIGLTEFVFKEIHGCTSQCPFCKVPCDAHSRGRTEGRHSAVQHRPQGLAGFRHEGSDKLVVTDCSTNVHSSASFRHGNNKVHYAKYDEVYPDWFIQKEMIPKIIRSTSGYPDLQIYWKWVFTKHNEQFASSYDARKAEIPEQWTKYGKEDIFHGMKFLPDTKFSYFGAGLGSLWSLVAVAETLNPVLMAGGVVVGGLIAGLSLGNLIENRNWWFTSHFEVHSNKKKVTYSQRLTTVVLDPCALAL